MTKWRVSYVYDPAPRGGPLRGKEVVERTDKPRKGDMIQAMFGRARIVTVSKFREGTGESS